VYTVGGKKKGSALCQHRNLSKKERGLPTGQGGPDFSVGAVDALPRMVKTRLIPEREAGFSRIDRLRGPNKKQRGRGEKIERWHPVHTGSSRPPDQKGHPEKGLQGAKRCERGFPRLPASIFSRGGRGETRGTNLSLWEITARLETESHGREERAPPG